MYPEGMVAPMRQELTQAGIEEARTADALESAINQKGTLMVVVNSIRGAAADGVHYHHQRAFLIDRAFQRVCRACFFNPGLSQFLAHGRHHSLWIHSSLLFRIRSNSLFYQPGQFEPLHFGVGCQKTRLAEYYLPIAIC